MTTLDRLDDPLDQPRLNQTTTAGLTFHGGDILGASRAYGIAAEQWLDLSTGIHPEPWQVPPVSQAAFERLPYERPEFLAAAARYYGRPEFLALAGTQAAIQRLPQVLPALPILLPDVGYQEHCASWRAAARQLAFYPSLQAQEAEQAIEQALDEQPARHLLLINPNNPSGLEYTPERLLAWAERLQGGGCLIVDEAFIDVTPAQSLLTRLGQDNPWPKNLVVLRSFGKFFGLAGIRLGFVFIGEPYRDVLREQLGPWSVNGPAQEVATAAFGDSRWQGQQSQALPQLAEQCRALFEPLLEQAGPLVSLQAAKPLFSAYKMPASLALALRDYFARHAILMRVVPLDEQQSLLRVGLLANCPQQQGRVRATLAAFLEQHNICDHAAKA